MKNNDSTDSQMAMYSILIFRFEHSPTPICPSSRRVVILNKPRARRGPGAIYRAQYHGCGHLTTRLSIQILIPGHYTRHDTTRCGQFTNASNLIMWRFT